MTAGHLILLVGNAPRNLALVSSFLEREGYHVCQALGYEDFDGALNRSELPDLAILDLSGFGREIWSRCEGLRKAGVPLIVVSPVQSAPVVQESRMHGARAVLTPPVVMRQLLGLIRSLLGS